MTVRLYEDNGGTLTLWHVEQGRGWSGLETAASRGSRFALDAEAIVRGDTADWTVDPVDAEPAHGDACRLVAEWRGDTDGRCEVEILRTPDAAARLYLGRRGRPPVSGEPMTVRFELRLTESDAAELRQRAAEAGEDVAVYLRRVALPRGGGIREGYPERVDDMTAGDLIAILRRCELGAAVIIPGDLDAVPVRVVEMTTFRDGAAVLLR